MRTGQDSLVVPAIKREPFMGSFLMAELIVVRIAYASSADFGKAEVNDSERNAVPVNNLTECCFSQEKQKRSAKVVNRQ